MIRNEVATMATVAEDWSSAEPVDSVFPDVANLIAGSAPTELPLKNYLKTRRRLHYEAMYFPLGYPVRVLSNSPEVLAAAEQSWNPFHPVFHREPLEVLLDVKPDAGSDHTLPPAPTHMLKGSLALEVADVNNYIIADLKKGRAFGRVTETTARSSKYLRYHFLEAATFCMLAALRVAGIHAACVRVRGKGVLLCGDSGDGKSTLAFAGARTGWTYVTDDASYIPLDRGDRLVVGNCNQVRFRPSAAALFPELAGRPITPRAAGKPSIEVRMTEWPHIATASATFVDHVVFLNRKCVDTEDLIPLRPSAVWPWFKQHLLSTESLPAQEAAVSRLLGAGVSELRYRDSGWAIERINQLVMKGN